jgi:hypothetical protein
MSSKYVVAALVLCAALMTASLEYISTTQRAGTYLADQCSVVIVGVECIGTVVSGTGNSNQGGGAGRPKFLSVKI